MFCVREGHKREPLELTGLELCDYFAVKVRSVLHIGAHLGQEIKEYKARNLEKVTLIEGNPVIARDLLDRVSKDFPGCDVINALIGSENKFEVDFFCF